MLQTAAKALVRSFFYQKFLPAQLPMQLLRGGNYLVLLSETPEEELELKQLGVPDFRIFNIEHDFDVYTLLSQRARRGELGAVLYYGELIEFITHHLHSNQRFLVLNLDIYGAYLNHIDPVLTPILLFARRNPRTIIATYSNGARDRPQLLEGLKSLAILRWLAPAQSAKLVDELFGRYQATGLSPSVSFNMVLRNLFWIRSHLEHTLISGVTTGSVPAAEAAFILSAFNECWTQASGQVKSPLRYGDWLKAIDQVTVPVPTVKCFGIGIHGVTVATYEAHNHMYHMGWFASYEPTPAKAASGWVRHTLESFCDQGLLFTNLEASSLEEYYGQDVVVPSELVIWERDGLVKPGRQLAVPEVNAELVEVLGASRLTTKPPTTKEAAVPATQTAQEPRELREDQVARIRDLARRRPDATTEDVIRSLRLGNYKPGSVRAHIAIARRSG